MRSAVVACVLLGCGFEHGIAPGVTGDGPMRDDAKDGGCASFSTVVDTCTLTGDSPLTLTAGQWTYNTDTHVLSNGSIALTPTSMVIDAAAGPIDIIFVREFTLASGATLRGTSPNQHRPFGIVATGPIQIDGTINVAAAGAGARTDAQCGALVGQPGQNNNGGGGGGGGGAFQGKGGTGSNGNSDGPSSSGGTGGTAIPARPASPIGGCDGGQGGDGNGTQGGDGGNGGGAVYLASGMSITIGATGVIDAGGGGGFAGGNNGDGGGGGGAGGMILLESKIVSVSGVVVANGGGGGEGNTNGNPGDPAQRSTQPASGGKDGDANGGDGGAGGAAIENDGVTTTDVQQGGGGGGGGAAGFVMIGCPAPTIATAAIISPDYDAW